LKMLAYLSLRPTAEYISALTWGMYLLFDIVFWSIICGNMNFFT
jgi:hypothetical protein